MACPSDLPKLGCCTGERLTNCANAQIIMAERRFAYITTYVDDPRNIETYRFWTHMTYLNTDWYVDRYTYATSAIGPRPFSPGPHNIADGAIHAIDGEITEAILVGDLLSMINQDFPDPFPYPLAYDGFKNRLKATIDSTGTVGLVFEETNYNTCPKLSFPLDLQVCCQSAFWKKVPNLGAQFFAAKTRYSVRGLNCIISNVPGDPACEQIDFGPSFVLHEIPVPPEPPSGENTYGRTLDVNCDCLAP